MGAAGKARTRTVFRSAVTGRFVRRGYAETHPDTTVAETVPVKPRKSGRKRK